MPAATRYAFFDLDHTLIPYDTQLLFCNFVLRQEGWRRIYLILFLPFLPFAGFRLVGARGMKRLFLSYLAAMPCGRLRNYARRFAGEVVAPLIYPELREELERHRREGRVIVLNSASPAFYVVEIARLLEIDHVFATPVRVDPRMPVLPVIEGPNNKRSAKLAAMTAAGLLPGEGESVDTGGYDYADSWAYSDSIADLPLLGLAANAVQVHPAKTFADIGRQRNWPVMRPKRPYNGVRSAIIQNLSMAVGLFSPEKIRIYWKKME